MPEISDYLKYAETSFASYATNLVPGPSGQNIKSLKDGGFNSEVQHLQTP